MAAYLAKYATKATEPTGLPATGRMTAEAAEYYSDAHTHLGRLVAYAHQFGTRPADYVTEEQKQDWHDTYCRLWRWTHMLGFGGHFATKSRRYSTTHQAMRAQRRVWQHTQRQDWRTRHHGDVENITLVICNLTLVGIGWHSLADAELAASAAARAREYRELAKQERTTA